RAFLAQFGRTFHAHWRASRVLRAREHVGVGRSLSDAGARAGFESESGMRSAFRAVLDATPREARERATVVVTKLASPLGELTAAATQEGICLLEFGAPKSAARASESLERVARRLECTLVAGTNAHLRQLRTELEAWFRGTRTRFDVPVVHAGTPFESEVWRALAAIPFGETKSYGELARALGRPGASRAVGRANGSNPIAILVPCHRVIGASGDLTGYAAGLDRKRWLLAHERTERSAAVDVLARVELARPRRIGR
ncbi:MAG TPA: methylated-DNA--[protein]-cysteine S-methyltransferase, partial [Planctomycetota bacterium]|nr:methylated-DNA--[protein]-cysteine S-methyltransferase [Planctomycetota bacterium]